MSKKKRNVEQFPEYLIQQWEANDCVNFGIALSRITGWILHVDWWSPTEKYEKEENMKPLRVYVGNNSNQIYDLRGKFTIDSFTTNIIMPILKKRGGTTGRISSRYYDEKMIFELPLRIKPNEIKILEACDFINKNKLFLDKIPKRVEPRVPAYIASRFTFGKCNAFAAALSDLKGFKATEIIAKKYNPIIANNKLGYVHSFVLDQDNNAIDVWGKDTIENIAKRFEVEVFELNESEHMTRNQLLKNEYPDRYEELYNESVRIINEYF